MLTAGSHNWGSHKKEPSPVVRSRPRVCKIRQRSIRFVSGRPLLALRAVYLVPFILFLPIYLEVSISFRGFGFAEDRIHLGNIKNVYFFVFLSIFTIFANKKCGTGSTSPIILILLFVNCHPMC